MGGGRAGRKRAGKNKKKAKGRSKNKKENKTSLQIEINDSSSAAPVLQPTEDLDALAAAIEAVGVSAVKEAPKTKTKRKRKRNRRHTKKANGDGAAGAGAAAAAPTYSEFKKEGVQDEVTALKSIFGDNFVTLPDADLPWQTGCPSFRIAQVYCVGAFGLHDWLGFVSISNLLLGRWSPKEIPRSCASTSTSSSATITPVHRTSVFAYSSITLSSSVHALVTYASQAQDCGQALEVFAREGHAQTDRGRGGVLANAAGPGGQEAVCDRGRCLRL